MSLSAIVIRFLLLVIVTGNLALVSVGHDTLVDVEAVAEWRLDPDAMDDNQGSEPPMPALVGHFREAIAYSIVAVPSRHYPQPVTEVRQCTCASRAPPSAILA